MYPFAMIAQSEETAAESRAPLEPRQVIARTVTRMARKRKILVGLACRAHRSGRH